MEAELYFNGVKVSEEEFNLLVAEARETIIKEAREISEQYGVSAETADAISYLRCRSRWTPEKEEELVKRDREGNPIPLTMVLSGEF